MMSFIVFMGFMITQATQPLLMGLMLVFTAVLVAFNFGLVMNLSWFSYIFFIIMVGGVLILFLYMASISPNSSDLGVTGGVMGGVLFFVLLLAAEFLTGGQVESLFMSTVSMYSSVSFFVVPILALYLLLAMMFIVYVTDKNLGPLRKI